MNSSATTGERVWATKARGQPVVMPADLEALSTLTSSFSFLVTACKYLM